MKPNFDYSLAPHNFIHCLNAQCPQAGECLRHQVFLRIPSECEYIRIVNPAHITPAGESCPYFMPDQLRQFALGITHLLDNVPHSDAIIIKQRMLNHFKAHMYYRFCRKERLINPDGQAYIRQLFLDRGITDEPVYDEYVEQYEW